MIVIKPNPTPHMITVLVIASNACNLDCTYCYRDHSTEKTLKYETFEKYIKNIVSYFHPETPLNIIFHGGEPLIAGYDFYEKAFILLDSFDREIHKGIQTNLTLLDDKFIKLFKANNCSIGTSLDGDDEINNKTRPFKNSANSSYQIVTEKIALLRQFDMSTGVISVLTDFNMNAKRYYDFAKNLNVRSVSFSPMFDYGNTDMENPAYEKLIDFLIQLFDLWIADDNPPEFDLYKTISHSLLGCIPINKCSFVEDCTRGIMTIDVDGSVYSCNHFLGQKEYSYGNVLTMPFEQIWNSPIRTKLSQRSKEIVKKCGACKYWDICHGGCMSHTNDRINEKDYFCKMYQRLFSHIEKTLNETIGSQA